MKIFNNKKNKLQSDSFTNLIFEKVNKEKFPK